MTKETKEKSETLKKETNEETKKHLTNNSETLKKEENIGEGNKRKPRIIT